MNRHFAGLMLAALLFHRLAAVAFAQDAVAQTSRFKIYGWVETGVTANPGAGSSRQSFGHLFTDRPNELLLNQAVLTVERTLGTSNDAFDWAFKGQFLYGSDARYIHSTGLFDNTQHELLQPDLVEAWILLHFPIAHTAGGLDLKGGKFVTLEGAETIDPRTNSFYSHSYIFNFGLPLNHTGVLLTLHGTDWLDLYAGATRGVNTSMSDNNSSFGFHGGIGVRLGEGKFSLLATTHIGPENTHDNHDVRYLNDIVFTWKLSNKWTAILEGNFSADESVPGSAKAYGGAAYLTYAANDWLSFALREEIFRDETGFFIGSFADNDDFIDIQRGETAHLDPRTFFSAGTFNEVTLGMSFKIPAPKPFVSLIVRPELRYDTALSKSTSPYAERDSRDQFTFSLDAILAF